MDLFALTHDVILFFVRVVRCRYILRNLLLAVVMSKFEEKNRDQVRAANNQPSVKVCIVVFFTFVRFCAQVALVGD